MSEHKNALPLGTTVGSYRIDAILGHGGFGIVYRAVHTRIPELVVAIKEFLPGEIATRDAGTVYALSGDQQGDFEQGLLAFLTEAKQLIRFNSHPNIVSCRDFFEANGTAYLVMDFEDGLPLSSLLDQRERAGNPLSEQEVRSILLPIMDGLAHIHDQDVLHRDIKPGNIFVRRADEQPVLLDFGAAKQSFSKHSKSRAAHTPGYAAYEQVEDEGTLGPWTDIYGLGGVLWRIVAGEHPPKVENRLSALYRGKTDPLTAASKLGKGRFSAQFLDTIDKAMNVEANDRFQTMREMINAFGVGEVPEPPEQPEPPKPRKPPKPPEEPPEEKPDAQPNGGRGVLIFFLLLSIAGLVGLSLTLDETKKRSAQALAAAQSEIRTLEEEVDQSGGANSKSAAEISSLKSQLAKKNSELSKVKAVEKLRENTFGNQVRFSNKCKYTVRIAIRWCPHRTNCKPDEWVTSSWWSVSPNSTINPSESARRRLLTMHDHVDVYAEVKDSKYSGTYNWTGDHVKVTISGKEYGMRKVSLSDYSDIYRQFSLSCENI